MTETLVHGYSSESIWQKLSNEYQHDWFKWFSDYFLLCSVNESSLSIGRVNKLLSGPDLISLPHMPFSRASLMNKDNGRSHEQKVSYSSLLACQCS